MRKIKGSGNYLQNQVRKNLAKAVLSATLFALIFFSLSLRALFNLNLDLLAEIGLLVSLLPLVFFYYYLSKYRIYRGGWEGEKQVIKLLSSKLSDDYFLLDNLYLRGGAGDIDHVVLAPSGVFVLETKNWNGEIICNGDEWQRKGKRRFKGSPSRQVKRNLATIRRIIDSSPTFKALSVHLEGIVIFTNNRARLHLNNPTVQIVRLPQLPNLITSTGLSNRFSSEQLEELGKEILNQKI